VPKVNPEDYRSVTKGIASMHLLKKMSLNPTTGDEIFNADYLSEEFHVSVRTTPVHRFLKQNGFPQDSLERLKWFATYHIQKKKAKLINLDGATLEQTQTNEKDCFKTVFQAKEFGFPLEKTFFLRYYLIDDLFVIFEAWTTTTRKDKFQEKAQFMGMSFSIDKKRSIK